jgi:hypothetical protein
LAQPLAISTRHATAKRNHAVMDAKNPFLKSQSRR